MKMKVVFISVLLPSVALAEPPPPDAPDAPPPQAQVTTGGVSVRLSDPIGRPLEVDAIVQVRQPGQPTRTLVLEGDRYVGRDLAAGSWIIEVVVDGFIKESTVLLVDPGAVTESTVEVSGGDESQEMVVVGLTEASELRRSSQAVTVIETEQAQTQSADLGEVMARTQGIGVRRTGGLGSSTRFSLAGLTDEQVRFFLDGIPLDVAGFPFGIANIPVDLVRRVEVYRGVVPVRFGADALGGAVNLVSEEDKGDDTSGASASYQVGSFATHRVSVLGRANAGAFRVTGTAYLDLAQNNYPIDVEVPDELGRLSPTTVRRFHDGYQAGGGTLKLGVVDVPWADSLLVRGFGASFRRDIQHNIVMTVPYGEPVFGITTGGGVIRYRKSWADWRVDGFVGTTRTLRTFTDVGECIVDWFGECVRELATPGEIFNPGVDIRVNDEMVLGRLRAIWAPSRSFALELAVSPQTFTRSGENLLLDDEARDPLTARRDASQVVSGLEARTRLWDDRVENSLFVKHYGQWVRSEEPLPGGTLREANRDTQRFGVGDGLRINLSDTVWLKTSYELATRLPTPTEIFGDAVLVVDNLELLPERSHNVNLGLTYESVPTPSGLWKLDTQLFGRFADELIVLLGNSQTAAYFNVFRARSVGIEASGSWSAPRDVVRLSANTTWLEFRNSSDEGTFGDFAGDRIPNRPWLFANATAQIGANELMTGGDRLSVDWYTRYTHPFFRGWESVGLAQFKQEIPAQLSHSVALTYAIRSANRTLSVSAEMQNLTNATLFDFFGVQRPGRSAFAKMTLGI